MKTVVKVRTQNGLIQSIRAQGHAGSAPSGENIVCAGLSSVLQTAILGLLNVAKIDVSYEIDDERAYLAIELPSGLNDKQSRDAEVILRTALCGVADFAEGFPQSIQLEVK